MNKGVLAIGLVVTAPLLAILVLNRDRRPLEIISPLIQKPAPSVVLQRMEDGAALPLESLRGRPVVVNFWASWCVPCVQEHASLTAGARQNTDVAFVGVVYEDSPENAKAFLNQRGRSYPIYLDEGAKAAIAFGVYGVPETFFINAQGTIVAKHVGAVDDQSLQERLAVARR